MAANSIAQITSGNPPPTGKAIAAAADAVAATPITVNVLGYEVNMIGLAIILMVVGMLYMFWRIQKSARLDFADAITKDGKSVSLTKLLQLIGGLTATWVMVKLTLTGGLTEALFGLYLTYVGAIEGYSKFVAAKYGYQEKGIKDAEAESTAQG